MERRSVEVADALGQSTAFLWSTRVYVHQIPGRDINHLMTLRDDNTE